MKKLLLLFAVLATALNASAYDFKVGELFFNKLSDNTCEVTNGGDGYNSYSSQKVTIPSTVTYNGTTYTVTTIGVGAFYGCSGLTSITIPKTIEMIGIYAFSDCSRLTSVTLPNSVTTIGYEAFSGCTSLTAVTIGNSITVIGYGMFKGCRNLTSITIPNSVTTIGRYAFEKCSGLKTATIGSSVLTIGEYAFSGCTGLQVLISLNGTPPYVEDSALSALYSKAELRVPQSAVSKYQSANEWKNFKTVVGI